MAPAASETLRNRMRLFMGVPSFRETSRQVLCRGLRPKQVNPVRAGVTTETTDTNRERVRMSERGSRSTSWAGLWRSRQIYGVNVLARVPYVLGISSNFGQAIP